MAVPSLTPFSGSSTTLKVAKELGRRYIGYELMEHYEDIIVRKLELAENFKNAHH